MAADLPALLQLRHVAVRTSFSELPTAQATCLAFVNKVSYRSRHLETFATHFVGLTNVCMSWELICGEWFQSERAEWTGGDDPHDH
jgi:hypothetical protein